MHLSIPRQVFNGFVVDITNDSIQDTFSSPVFKAEKEALDWANTWLYWAENVQNGTVDSIYYIVQIPDTWVGPPKGAHLYSGLHVKIGRSRNVLKRLANLQTGTFGQLVINALEPGGSQREKELHVKFAEERRKGEWFICSPELYQHIFHTWFQYKILPQEHQFKVLETLDRAQIYGSVREVFGGQPDMVNPSINEEWHGSVFVDLVHSNIVRK